MKRKILIFLLVAALLSLSVNAAWVSESEPYVKVETAYSEGVSRGSVRYISQIPESENFHSAYWPDKAFGGYRSPKNECGTASISMALSYIGINKTPKMILEANNGYTYFSGWGVQTATPSVAIGMQNYLSGNAAFSPVIIHLPGYSSAGHWIILIGRIRENVYRVLDPATAELWSITVNGNRAQYVKDGRSVYDTIDRTYQYYSAHSNCPSENFSDIGINVWYHDSVDFVLSRGLFGGMSETVFAPETPMTRAMFVTVLWRLSGQKVQGENRFTDVKDGQWYTKAVSWAAYHGIINGVSKNRFEPEGRLTREQMAVILYRYARFNSFDTSSSVLLTFTDTNHISGYAAEAMCWAIAEGVINGSDGKLLPQGSATRAQTATILMRFVKKYIG